AAHAFHDANKHFMPGNDFPDLTPAIYDPTTNKFSGVWSDPRFAGLPYGTFSWAAYILPSVEGGNVFRAINFKLPASTPYFEEYSSQAGGRPQPYGDPLNTLAATSMPAVFVCPAARRARPENEQKDYGINGGIQSKGCCAERSMTNSSEGMAWLRSKVRMGDVRDGTSNTFFFFDLMNYAYHGRIDYGMGSNPFIFVNEAGQGYVTGSTNGTVAGAWLPNDETSNHRGPESMHTGGVFAAMADGH